MPINRDDIEQGDSPITPPEGDIDERELSMPEPVLAPSSKWDWIGSPSRPEAQEYSDGISDLFTVTDEDIGASDEDLSDLTDVNLEEDILDAGPDGSLNDLVDVSQEDIMGSAPRPKPRYRINPRVRRLPDRYNPPTSMGRSG